MRSRRQVTCGSSKENTLAASETPSTSNPPKSLAEAYIAAYQAKDARAYLSLFSRDADYVDFAVQVHAKIGQLKDELASSFRREGFHFHIHTYFISGDGQSVALQGTYTDSARTGEPVSVPIASFLQISGDKITREALYYDGSLFKRHLHSA
jgi:ketosteroid isomerase-like protein